MKGNGKTICIDFDGVISNYKGYKGWGVFEPPVDGTIEYMNRLKADGWRIIIFTCRNETKLIQDYCEQHCIPVDEINRNSTQHPNTNMGKPYADVYLDDRGMCFKGDWKKTYSQLKRFKPWNDGLREI